MNVFVLCTGRSGSQTFARACSHITNFTSAHESRVHRIGDDRVDFPENHIEIDMRLSFFLGRLDERFGDNATYVHLTRDPVATAASWTRRYRVLGGMATGYRDHILAAASSNRRITRWEAAEDYVRSVTENISLFLKDKSRVIHVRVNHAEPDFRRFWAEIGAEGDVDRAVAEWRVKHDAERIKPPLKQRVWNAAQRVRRTFFPPP